MVEKMEQSVPKLVEKTHSRGKQPFISTSKPHRCLTLNKRKGFFLDGVLCEIADSSGFLLALRPQSIMC